MQDKLALETPRLHEVTYIRVLEYATNQAAGVGTHGEHESFGFSWSQIRTAPELSDISDVWLRELVHTICTIRNPQNEEIRKPQLTDVTDTNRYVIKAEAYMRYLTFVELTKLNTSVEQAKLSSKIAQRSLVVASFALLVTLVTLLWEIVR